MKFTKATVIKTGIVVAAVFFLIVLVSALMGGRDFTDATIVGTLSFIVLSAIGWGVSSFFEEFSGEAEDKESEEKTAKTEEPQEQKVDVVLDQEDHLLAEQEQQPFEEVDFPSVEENKLKLLQHMGTDKRDEF